MLGAIVENAVQWSSRIIRIRAHDCGASQIRIEDDGPGLTQENLQQLGTRGLRLDESSSGTGLGISIVREISSAYGARLTFEAIEPHGCGRSSSFLTKPF